MNGAMKILAPIALLALTLPAANAVAAPAARKVARKAPVKIDWTRRVAVTTDGGFLVGNPAAKAKLVEYGSLSCPSCQRFHQDATAGLRAQIATGKLSFEFHPFAVHSADPILHALLRCAGPARFVKFSDDFYDDQPTLAAAYEKWAEANPTVNPITTAADRIKYAQAWGFTAFATAHGLTRTQVDACLSNADALLAQQQREDQANRDLGVSSTPTLFLNGQRLPSWLWSDVEQAIAAALAA